MADSKISGYSELAAAPASGDLVEIVDVSDTSMAASGTNKKITITNLLASLSGYQPLDADLTAIAALTTTAFGRSLLEAANAAALRTLAGTGTIATQDANNVTVTGGSISATALTLVQSTTAAPTAEGRVEWDTDDNKLKIGDGAATKTFSDDSVNAATYQPLDADLTAIAALTTTAFGRALLELADAAALRTAGGLGTIATQAANNVTITGGSITGITDLAVADGGTGASTAAAALANLGGSPSVQTINAQTGTTYTIVLTDVDKIVTQSNAGAITTTLPQDSDVAVPVGTHIDFIQIGAGQVTFAAGTGATVNGTPGLKLRAQWSAASAIKRAANTWVVIGDLSA